MKNTEKKQRTFVSILITHLIYGVLSAFLVLLLVLLFSILISKEILPEDNFEPLGVLCVFLSSIVSCFLLARTQGKVLLTATIQGIFNFALYYITGMLIFVRVVPGNISLYYFIACMVGAVVGGILSAVFTPQRRRIKNKQRRMLS